jgi:hypothetical protein
MRGAAERIWSMKHTVVNARGWFWVSLTAAAAGSLIVALLPWETVGAPVLSVLLAGGIALGLAVWDSPAEERRFVIRLLLVALGMRLLAAVVFYLAIGGNEGYLYSDAGTYDRVAWVFAQAWRAPGTAVQGLGPVEFVLDDSYPRILAGLYFLIGHSPAAAVAINAVLGASSVYLVYRIGATLFEPVTARWAGWLTAFYTGFWLDEMMTMKDALFLFLILLFFLALYRFWYTATVPDLTRGRILRSAGWFAAMILAAATAGQLRNYAPVVLACAAVLLPAAAFLGHGGIGRWLLAVGVSAVVLAVLWPRIAAFGLPNISLGEQSTLIQFTEVPETGTIGSFLQWILGHPLSFGRYIVLAVFSTALAQYAWIVPGSLPEVPHFETYMITYPGMWMWYLLIPFALFGTVQAFRRSRGEVLPLVFYAAALFLAVAVFIPREARHRDMVMPVALLLGAVGLVHGRKWWALGLLVWIPLIGFIAWKMQSFVPILLALGAAAAGILVWHVRMIRRRDSFRMRGG